MKRRFASGGGSISFFAFQDIITAVTGIMVLIALLMALQLTSGAPAKPRIDPKLSQLHAQLSAERDELHAKIAAVAATAKKTTQSTENTQAEMQNVESMIRELNRESARLVQESQSFAQQNPSEVKLESVRQANEEGRQAVAKAQEENALLSSQIEELEGGVEKAQAAALAVASNTTDIWLNHERSDTSKEPVIVSVLAESFVAQRLDTGAEKSVLRKADAKSISDVLEGSKPTDQFVVLYFKPSTLSSFHNVVNATKDLGYEVGYDIVEEEGTVRFTSALDQGERTDEPSAASSSQQEQSNEPDFTADVDIKAEVEQRGDPVANGSGFFISSAGHFVTNEHVASAGNIFFIGSKTAGWKRAKLLSVDQENDLALLKVEAMTEPFFVQDSGQVALGQTVATIGFPNVELQGLSPKFTKGEISSLAGIQDDPTTFQVSVPVQPGNSGGPLFEEKGNVVGVVSARLDQDAALAITGSHVENVNYAVKSKVLLDWLASLAVPDLQLAKDSAPAGTFQDAVKKAEQSTAMILIYR
jgi:S1-C subfamily serine protease